jgi:HlyD family secretion protein
MKITRSRVLWIATGVAGLAALAAVLRPAPVAVDTATLARGPLQLTVDDEGVTRLARRYVVAAPVAGTVRRIDLRPGDAVGRGQIVATIDPAAATPLDARTLASGEARVRAADAAVGRAEAEQQRAVVERDRAGDDATRAQRLFEAGIGSREAYETAAARFKAAQQASDAAAFARRAAGFDAEAARANLGSYSDRRGAAVVVRSPIDGVILQRLHESEGVTPAGTALVEIGNVRDLEVLADLLTTDAVNVRPGAAVRIDRWGGEPDLMGTVERVEPAGFMKISALGVEEQRVNVVIRLDTLPDVPVPLGDGFRVTVHVVIWERADVLRIPTSALFRRDGSWAAFVLVDGRLVVRSLTVGQRGEHYAELLAGGSAGDVVVVYPGESLAPGMRAAAEVTPRQ